MSQEFFVAGSAPDEAYVFNRDHQSREDVRVYLNDAWRKCGHLVGEADFRERAKVDFNSQAWHLHLVHCLTTNGHKVEPASAAGPDIKLLLGKQIVWIEAISVKAGTGVDEVKKPPKGFATRVPDEKIMLRHTAGISEKFNKYQGWAEKGIVRADDPFLIALNVGDVPSADLTGGELNFLERAVFGLGGVQWQINIDTKEVVEVSHVHLPAVAKPSNSAEVPTTYFASNKYESISGVLYSVRHIVNVSGCSGKELELLHNPFAKNKLSLGAMALGTEKWVEESTGLLQRKVWAQS